MKEFAFYFPSKQNMINYEQINYNKRINENKTSFEYESVLNVCKMLHLLLDYVQLSIAHVINSFKMLKF